MQRLLGSSEYKFERIEFVPSATNNGLSAPPGIEPMGKMRKVIQQSIHLFTAPLNLLPAGNALLFADASIASFHRPVHAQDGR